ncbi:MAG: hypothetical protein GY866_32825, partial [Proteobacteria bacterium]|nr:hypothetical protein [Pseudomonadota bacterium]
MLVDQTLLENFEAGLDTRNIGKSKIKATIIGYGEISTIFQIGDDRSVAYKRMPLFDNRTTAETYETLYHEYCGLLAQAGISLPESGTAIVQIPKRPVVLYIGQTLLPADRLCHRLIHKQDEAANKRLLESVMAESEKIWH